MFPVIHVFTILITRFYFSILAISFSILADTLPMDAAHLSLYSPAETCCSYEERWNRFSQEMLHIVHLPASYRNYKYESTDFLEFNNVTYIYHKVGLFQIM